MPIHRDIFFLLRHYITHSVILDCLFPSKLMTNSHSLVHSLLTFEPRFNSFSVLTLAYDLCFSLYFYTHTSPVFLNYDWLVVQRISCI